MFLFRYAEILGRGCDSSMDLVVKAISGRSVAPCRL